MKKVLASLLAIIIVFSFGACGNSSSSDEDYIYAERGSLPLTAENFTNLKASDGFIYCMWHGLPCALYFTNGFKAFKCTYLDTETFEVNYSKLANDSDVWNLEVYNTSNISLSLQDWGTTYSYSLDYSDSDDRFVVFVDRENIDKEDFIHDSFIYNTLICMSKETFQMLAQYMLLNEEQVEN